MNRLLASLLPLLLAGCAASPSPNYDMRFGDAVREARQRMTLNPNAGRNADPVAGVDGRTVHEALGRYYDPVAPTKSPTQLNINIGGAIGGSGN